MKITCIRIAMVVGTLSITLSLFSQVITSSLTGTVTDSSGAGIPGATVTIEDSSHGVSRTTTTNATGSYLVSALPAGTYRLTIEAKGFATYQAISIRVEAVQQTRADAILTVGLVSTHVTVEGTNIGQVEMENAQLAGTVTGTQITQLELNGRDFTQLIKLVPGVASQTGQDEGVVGEYGSEAYSVNGGRVEYNNWEVDGVSIMDSGCGGTCVVTFPSIDAIGETRVLTSNAGAQYGQDASGALVAVLKSGTNQFHGDVYEFNRNDVFNARNFFAQERGAYKKNDFGYTLGGPFYIPGHYNSDKSKTFFFWSEEWRKEVAPTAFDVQVPSTAERQGDFSDVCPNAATNSLVDCPTNPATGAYFPGNQVTVDPNAQALMGMISAPNTGSGALSFFQSSPSFATTWREELIRVDQNITPRVRAMVHYIHDSWNTIVPGPLWTTASFPTVNTDFISPGDSLVAQLTATASPTLLNQFIFGYSVNHIVLYPGGSAWQIPANFSMTGLFNNGFGGKLPSIGSICCNAQDAGGSGFGEDPAWVNPLNPHYNSNPVYSFRDMLTKIWGHHNLTLGGDFIAIQKNEMEGPPPSNNGSLTFSNTSAVSTGNAWADFLTGRIAEYSQLNQRLKYYDRNKEFGPYLQDDWHVSPRLTLNLGFRAELIGRWTNKYHTEATFSPASYNPAEAPQIDVTGSITGYPGALVPGVGNEFDGLIICGAAGVPVGCVLGHLFNPAPRLGFAWDPTGHGMWAVRGGYGIYYDRMNGNEVSTPAIEGTPPFALTPSTYNVVGYENISSGTPVSYPLNTFAFENQVLWPYVQQWNIDLEHNLKAHMLVRVAYVGSKGTHLTDVRDLNQIPSTPLAQNPFGPGQPITSDNCSSLAVNGQPVTGQALANLQVACGANPVAYRPITGYNDLTLIENGANSNYNALQVYVQKTTGRLNFSVAYTYSHSLDDSSDRFDSSFVDSHNLRGSYASSTYDQRHVLNVSYVYNLSFFHNQPSRLLRNTLGGWETSGIATFQTGAPITVTNGVYGGNAGVANGVSGVGSYPDICGNINASPPETNVPGVIGPLLYNPAAFCAPRGLTFGDAGRNILREPNLANWDMGLFKDIPIHREQVHLQFRAEAFNIFNTTNLFLGSGSSGTANTVTAGCYAGANNSAGDPSCIAGSTFLHATGAHNPRILQLGMKLIF